MEEMVNIEEILHLELYFPPEKVKEPILHTACNKNNVEFNIEKSRVNQDGGRVSLYLSGRETKIMKVMEELLSQGIRIQYKK